MNKKIKKPSIWARIIIFVIKIVAFIIFKIIARVKPNIPEQTRANPNKTEYTRTNPNKTEYTREKPNKPEIKNQ